MPRFNRKEHKNNQQWVPVPPKPTPLPLKTPLQHPRFFRAVPLPPLTKVESDTLASIHSIDLLHIIMLIDLKYDGGSADFLNYYPNDSQFTSSHYIAWKILLFRQDISIVAALSIMQDASEEKAYHIAIRYSDGQTVSPGF